MIKVNDIKQCLRVIPQINLFETFNQTNDESFAINNNKTKLNKLYFEGKEGIEYYIEEQHGNKESNIIWSEAKLRNSSQLNKKSDEEKLI